MNRTKAISINLIFALLLQVFTFFTGILSARWQLLIYGSEINGLISSIHQFITYINLVEIGLTSASVIALYKPIETKNETVINGILSATKNYYTKSGYFFVSLIIALAALYPFFTQVSSLNHLEVVALVFVLSISGAVNFFVSAKFRVLLIADQRQYVLSIINISSLIINTIIIYFFGYILKVDIFLLKSICLISVILPTLLIIIFVRFKYKDIKFNNTKPNYDALQNRYTVLVNEIAGTIHFGCPIVILTLLSTLYNVSVYSVYMTIFNGINGVLSSIVVPIGASFGALLVSKNNTSFKSVYSQFEGTFYIVSSALFACVLALILPFIQLYTNGVTDVEYYQPLLALLLAVNYFVLSWYTPYAILVRATGKFKEVRNQTIIQALITLVLSTVGVILLGMIGVVIASVIANIYRSISMVILFNKKLDGVSAKKTLMRFGLGVINFCCIISLLKFDKKSALFSFLNFEIANYWSWIVYAVVVCTAAAFVSLSILLIFERKEFIGLIKRIFRMVKGVKG